MTNQGESVNQSQSTQYVSQMTPGNTKKGNMTHWLVNLDTGPGLTFMSQLDSGLDMSVTHQAAKLGNYDDFHILFQEITCVKTYLSLQWLFKIIFKGIHGGGRQL